jgi:hypothetical protein
VFFSRVPEKRIFAAFHEAFYAIGIKKQMKREWKKIPKKTK